MSAIIIVPCTSAFGTVFLPSLVSPARNVGDSQPKKVSAMAKIAKNTTPVPRGKKGLKFSGLKWIKPGTISEASAASVINAKTTSIVALIFMPL